MTKLFLRCVTTCVDLALSRLNVLNLIGSSMKTMEPSSILYGITLKPNGLDDVSRVYKD